MAPMPVCSVARSGIRSATCAAIAVVELGPRRRADLDQRAVDVDPAEHLADVDLVAPERARHLGVGLEEEPGPPDERRRRSRR